MTTQDKTPIRALIEAVEDGRISTDLIMDAFGNGWDDIMVLGAFDGYLDAAKELHEALLPGWQRQISESNAKVYERPNIAFFGEAVDNDARAWLLAILNAYRGMQG